jgi:hypothetical protein
VYAVTDVAPVPIGGPGIAAGGWLFHFAMPQDTTGRVAIEAAEFAKFLTNDQTSSPSPNSPGHSRRRKRRRLTRTSRTCRWTGAYGKAMAIGAKSMNIVRTLMWPACGIRAVEQAAAGRGRGGNHRPQGHPGRPRRRGGILEQQASQVSMDSARIAVPEPRGMPARRAPDRQSRGDGASRPRARQARQAWLFLTPALVLLAVFTFWPVS